MNERRRRFRELVRDAGELARAELNAAGACLCWTCGGRPPATGCATCYGRGYVERSAAIVPPTPPELEN